MADLRESSLLFSLNRLMEREKERVLEEQRERELNLAQERVLRERLEQQKKEAEQRRMVDEERRKIAEAARLREEAARVEAIRSAEIERVRAQVSQKTELELQAKEHEHQRRMDAMPRDAKLGQYKALSIGSSVFSVVVVLGGAVLYFGKLVPDSQESLALLEARVAAQNDRAEQAVAEADRGKLRERALARRLEDTQKKLEDALARPDASKAIVPNPSRRPKSPAAPNTKKPRHCSPGLEGDPMNGCL